MRSFLLVATLCLCSVISNARTFYVSPTGNNNNPGTIDAPFLTLEKLNSVLGAGDIAYIRGGTYRSTKGNGGSTHFLIQNLFGTALNPIKIWAYPGETPIFNLDNITPTYANPFAMEMNGCEYVHLKGFVVKNLKEISTAGTNGGVSRGFILSNSNYCTVELLDVYNMSGTGFTMDNSDNNLILNVDSHHNGDGLADSPWDSGDGFSIGTGGDVSSNNIFDGCRAYLNSDDGMDGFDWAGTKVTYRNCWAFWNGVKPWGANTQPNEAQMTPTDPAVWWNNPIFMVANGVGEGFKLGGYGGYGPPAAPTTIKKYLNNCVAFENSGVGFSQNMEAQYAHQMQFLNCEAYGNGNDGFGFGVGRSTGIAHIFKNNWAYNNNRLVSGADWVYDGLPDNISNNYWNTTYGGINYGNLKTTVSITPTDFLSTSSAGVAGARQADGSLPNINFLKLATNSDVINKGVNVGLPYVGAAPDLGAFENGAFPVPITLVEFTATAKIDKTVLLKWKTSSEINSDYFVIERSADGVNFTQVAIVNANDNSSDVINYQFIDNLPGKSLNFYRLKMVDNDGRFKFSNIAVVSFKASVSGNISILTNTADQQHFEINLNSGKSQSASYSIFDATGRMLYSSNLSLQNGVNNISKNMSLPGGVYYFRLETADEKISLPMVSRN